jgi:hypothetical protein
MINIITYQINGNKSKSNLSMHVCEAFFSQQVTHSQLLEGFKRESQTENNEKVKSRGMFLGS